MAEGFGEQIAEYLAKEECKDFQELQNLIEKLDEGLGQIMLNYTDTYYNEIHDLQALSGKILTFLKKWL